MSPPGAPKPSPARGTPGTNAQPVRGDADPLRSIAKLRQTRRLTAVALQLVGLLDVVTAVLPPSRRHLTFLLHYAPLVVAQGAAALLALCGLLLLALGRGLRRGQRQAWVLGCTALAVGAVLHLARGLDGAQSVVSLLLLAFVITRGGAFFASVDRRVRRSVTVLAVGSLTATVVVATASIEAFLALDGDGRRVLPLHVAIEAVAERLIGVEAIGLPVRVNRSLSPVLLGVGLSLIVLAVLAVSQPLRDRRHRAATSDAAARRLVDRHGGGTLDYFALRDDKQHFFNGETLITYALRGGVCLVSPDPIGPADERVDAWTAFCLFASARGWAIVVLGASESWLPLYRRSGMRSLYIGDEAIVNVAEFDVAGGKRKGLRQAVNRVRRYGYRVSFHDPGRLDPDLATSLRRLMGKSRRGEEERGFSMTLGRLFDPDDTSLLLAVVHAPDGHPAAFCQFVPAPSIGGYSLDLMRRDPGEHPNGLIDFLIVSTIEHLREQGMTALGLNFATMRAVLAGETGHSLRSRALRGVLSRLSSSMQIESLWRFTAKFGPEWAGRHLVFESLGQIPAVGLAVARAESFSDLPVVGRFLRAGRTGIMDPFRRHVEQLTSGAAWIDELRRPVVAARRQWSSGRRPWLGASTATLTLVVYGLLHVHSLRASLWHAGAVHASLPITTELARLPASVFLPTPYLPVWAAAAQLLVVLGLGELLVGRWWTVGTAVVGHVTSTLAARAALTLDHGHLLAFAPALARALDTGPSGATTAVGMCLLVGLGMRRYAGVLCASLVLAGLLAPGLDGIEHLIALACGLMAGLLWHWTEGPAGRPHWTVSSLRLRHRRTALARERR